MSEIRISGMGAVCAAGFGTETLWHALKAGRSLVRDHRGEGEPSPNLAAAIEGFDLTAALETLPNLPEALLRAARRAAQKAPLALQLSLAVALEAWLDAGLHEGEHDSERLGLVVAGNNLSNGYTASLVDKFRNNPNYLPPSYGLNFLDTHHVGTISEVLGIRGEGYTVGGASGSGGVALVHGLRLLRHGYLDRCLVVGAPALLGPMERMAFFQMGAMGGRAYADAPEQACRPFDAAREGFLPGEGAACLILEREELAQARGARCHGHLLAATTRLDANRMTDPSVAGEVAVMRAALTGAGLAPEQVAYINAHGTASRLGDEVELQAIDQVFGNRPWLSSSKGILGHCLFAAGVIEVVATLQQMQNGFLHGSANLDQPMLEGPRWVPVTGVAAEIPIALSNSFGFGGINASALLRRPETAPEPRHS